MAADQQRSSKASKGTMRHQMWRRGCGVCCESRGSMRPSLRRLCREGPSQWNLWSSAGYAHLGGHGVLYTGPLQLTTAACLLQR